MDKSRLEGACEPSLENWADFSKLSRRVELFLACDMVGIEKVSLKTKREVATMEWECRDQKIHDMYQAHVNKLEQTSMQAKAWAQKL